MPSNILIKRSSTASAIPTAQQLLTGELAINLADKKLYTNNNGSIIELGTLPSSLSVSGDTALTGSLGVTGATTLTDGNVSGDFTVVGTLTVSTPTSGTDAASKAYVDTSISSVIDSSPALLNTLNELAAAINDDPSFATTVANSVATKVNKAGDTLTGDLVMGGNKITSTATPVTDDTLTRKGYVDSIFSTLTAAETSATASASSAIDSANSATAASASTTTATTKANEASTSATNAANSASAASTSATSASTSASSASTSASAASTSETNSENIWANFEQRYLGSLAAAPAPDSDAGSLILEGTLYWNSVSDKLFIYTGNSWVLAVDEATSIAAALSEAAALVSENNAAASASAALTSETASITSATNSAASAASALTSKTAATAQAVIATEKAATATTKANEASASATTATTKAALATNEANRAETEANNAAAVVTGGTATLTATAGKIPLADVEGKIDTDWLGAETHSMSKADFFAQAEKRIRDGAGSGFAEWGKERVEPNYWKTVANGMGTATDGIYANSNLYLAKLNAVQTGVSGTGHPLVNVNGASLNISHVNDAASYGALIKFPPAPDGTKTYDSATGSVVEHASAAEAFEGLVTNGDFRDGSTGWTLGTGWSLVNDTLVHSGSGGDIKSSIVSTVSGTTYEVNVPFTNFSQGGVNTQVQLRNVANTSNFVFVDMNSPVNSDGTVTLSWLSNGSDVIIRVYSTDTITVHSTSIMPATEQVITSRQDFTFLESFHEKISDKDVVYPLGNVQYGATTWEGITLSNTVEAQGYSAFGEWDTTTKGYGVVWSTLSDANKAKFLQDPENNIYNDDGELIQVRYRVRVIEGLGDAWANTDVQSSSLAHNTTAGYVIARGNLSSVADLAAATSTFYSVDSNGQWKDVAGTVAHNGLCFAVPIALVQRRNSGAYHPVFNSEGTRNYYVQGVVTYGDWYQANTGTIPFDVSSKSNCFVEAAQGASGGYNISSGSISSTTSGHPSNLFYDAIYASDVQDLRMSSKRLPRKEIREKYKRMAIAGDVRGFEGVPFMQPLSFDGYNNNGIQYNYYNSTDIYIYTSDIATANASPATYRDDALGTLLLLHDATLGYTLYGKVAQLTSTTAVVKVADLIYDDFVGTPSGYGNTVHAWLVIPQTHKQASPTWTDIIGSPANIAATFPQGVEGQWIPVVPDGFIDTFPLNRKSLDTSIGSVITPDIGATWSVATAGVSATANTIGWNNHAAASVSLNSYETQAHFTQDDVNSEVLDLGGVYAGGWKANPYGNTLLSSLIGKIGTWGTGNSKGVGWNAPLTEEGFRGTGKFDKAQYAYPSHTSIDLTSQGNTVKTLDYLSQENNVAKLMYAYKEMVYDSGDDSVGDFADQLESYLGWTSGTNYHITTGNFAGYYKCVTTTAVALTDPNWSFDANGDIMYSNGNRYFELWDGNGFGDNNQFEITNNQATQTDDNGNTILYGTASFNTQYFITEE